MALPSVAALSNSKDATTNGGVFQVKEECPDDAEIKAMAEKLLETNKAKMAAAASNARPMQMGGSAGIVPGSIQSYMLRGQSTTSGTAISASTAHLVSDTFEEGAKKALDEESQRGRFGWHTAGSVHIPYILRNNEKYCAVRMAETKLLNKYLCYLKPDIYTCTCIRSFYMSEAEARLMNEINMKHCDGGFGNLPFSMRDLVVLLKDAEEFQSFLEVCINKLAYDWSAPKDKCGFIRINGESVVPFTLCGEKKFVPLFYFEGETDTLRLRAEKLEGWDLAYLKFCCKVQGIRSELFSSETCSVISLSDIRSYFPPGTIFEDYWPSKGVEKSLLLDPNRGQGGPSTHAGAWTVQPQQPPPNPKPQTPKPAPAVQPATTSSVLNGWAGLAGGQVSYTHNAATTAAAAAAAAAAANLLQQVQQQQLNQQLAARLAQPMYRAPTNMLYGSNNIVPLQTGTSHQYYQQVSQPQQVAHNLQTSTPQPPPLIRVSSASGSSMRPGQTYTSSSSQQAVPSSQSQVVTASQMLLNLGTTTTSVQQSAQQLLLQQQQQQRSHQAQQQQQQHHQQQQQLRLQQMQQQLRAQAQQQQAQQTQQAQQVQQAQQHLQQQLQLQQQRTRQQAQQQQAQANAAKYPPPLVPSNGTSSISTRSQQLRSSTRVQQQQQQQQQQQLLQQQQQQQQQSAEPSGNRKLIPIPEVAATITGQHMPYKTQKALVAGHMVPCINSKPYHYSELLMTMPDLVEEFFPNLQLHNLRKILQEVLGIELYRGNRLQMQILLESGKCMSVSDVLPLVQVRDVMQYMPQMSYMINRMCGSNGDQPNKRQRTS